MTCLRWASNKASCFKGVGFAATLWLKAGCPLCSVDGEAAPSEGQEASQTRLANGDGPLLHGER